MNDDRLEAFQALADAGRAMGKALRSRSPRERAQQVLEDLRELERTQPFQWIDPNLARRWFETLIRYKARAQTIVDGLTKQEAAQ